MSEQFIGLYLSIRLETGVNVTGKVISFDQNTKQLNLENVTLEVYGMTQSLAAYAVIGSTIADLQIVNAPAITSSNGTTHSSPPLHRDRDFNAAEASDTIKPQSPSKSSRRKKSEKRTPRNRFDSNNAATFSNGQSNDYEEDFDFQANLDQFDKQQVFEEIKKEVNTRPEELLVNLNLRSKMMEKIPHTQNVLDIQDSLSEPVTPSGIESDINDEHSESNELDSTLGSGRSIPFDSTTYFETLSHVYVPSVTPKEMKEIWNTCIDNYSIHEDILIENGGRGLAMLSMQILGGSRRIRPGNHNEKPVIAVLAGSWGISGAFAVAAARHLLNHECDVFVVYSSVMRSTSPLSRQLKIFQSMGGNISPNASANVVDLILDGLLDISHNVYSLSAERDRRFVYESVTWALSNRAPIISVDMATGIDASLGTPFDYLPEPYLNPGRLEPRYTAVMGLPKTGHLKCKDFHGQLMLIDIGLPTSLLSRLVLSRPASAKRFQYVYPFEDKYIAGLSLVSK